MRLTESSLRRDDVNLVHDRGVNRGHVRADHDQLPVMFRYGMLLASFGLRATIGQKGLQVPMFQVPIMPVWPVLTSMARYDQYGQY